jgi:hypothetical protein
VKAKSPYTWVKRATAAERREMEDCVAALNETAHEQYDVLGYTCSYKLERGGDAWGVTAYVAKVHPEVRGDVSVGERNGGGTFARCATCGHVRDLWDGQIEFCTECWTDW